MNALNEGISSVFSFSLDDGLSHPICNTIIKDGRGYVWIGTQDGLCRYDSERFKVFKNIKSDKSSIAGNFINNLYEDSRGHIWYNTVDNGIGFFDVYTHEFIKVEGVPDVVGLSQQKITENEKGDIFFVTESTLYEIKMDNLRKVAASKKLTLEGDENITALIRLDEDGMLLGGEKGSIRVYKKNRQTKIGQIPEQSIGCIGQLNDEYFFGTYSGLWACSKSNQNLIEIMLSEAGLHIYDITTKNDNIWVASADGVFQITSINDKYRVEQFLAGSTCFSLCCEQSRVWVATTEGAKMIETQTPVFENILAECSFKDEMENWGTVSAFYETNQGLWIGLRGQGLVLKTDNSIHHYHAEHGNANFASNHIRTLCVDRNNQLWIGTIEGLSILDLNTFQPNAVLVKNVKISPTVKGITAELANNTRHIYEDRAGNIWISSFLGGLFRFTGDIKNDDFTFQHYANSESGNGQLPSNDIHRIIEGDENRYWVASRSGLISLDFPSDGFINPNVNLYQHDDRDVYSIGGNVIYDLFVDVDHSLWIGTTQGLTHFYPEADSGITYDSGLTSLVINGIVNDKSNNIWVSTNDGICQLNKSNNKFECYSKKDGLPQTVYEIFCTWKDSGDNLIFGGVGGATSFQPADIDRLKNAGTLVFTEYCSRANTTQAEGNSFVCRTTLENDHWNVLHNAFPLSLKFSDLNLRPNKNNEYFYKLEPQDKQWNSLGSQCQIDLASLNRGNHTLLIQGGKHGAHWSVPPLKLSIKVIPPFWRSTVAYVLYGIGLASFLWGIFWMINRNRNQKIELQRMQKLNDLKTKLYANITHEFRSPLTIIQGITDKIGTELNKQKITTFNKSLEMIQKSNAELLRYINQILDVAKTNDGDVQISLMNGNVVPFIHSVFERFAVMAEKKDITPVFYPENETIKMDYDEERLTTIISNLLSNAVKNTPRNGKVVCHIKKDKIENMEFLFITIKDTGVGIKMQDIPHVFDRFYSVSDKENTSHGTGIGLALTRDLVHLFNGEIIVDSTEGNGACFEVRLPILEDIDISGVQVPSKEDRLLIKSDGEQTSSTIQILLVEDNDDVAGYITSCLDQDYEIIRAKNGIEGFEQAVALVPDLIISDIMMPKKDGLELCGELKSDARTDHIPVIMLTAKVQQSDKILGLKRGADAYITKPFHRAELLIRIKHLINTRQQLIEKYSQLPYYKLVKGDRTDVRAQFVQKASKIVLDHIDDEDFGIDILANKLHLSSSQTYRKLKAITGKSTARFIRSIRLEIAHKHLRESAATISEISYKSGFNNISYFNRAFKEEFGLTPGELRKSLHK